MILLKSENGDFIYLDVITQLSKNFSSQVTQHPVDGSGTVSDHVIKNNPRFQLVGKITGADFNSSKPNLTSETRAFIGIDQVVVSSDVAGAIEVSYENNVYNLLPDVVGQFFSETLPEIENINETKGASYTEKALFSVLRSFRDNKRKLTIYEFEGDSVSGDLIEDVYITNLSVNETVSDGDALAFDITLEQVTISNLIEVEIETSRDVRPDLQVKAEEKSNKGGQTATEVSPPESTVENLTGLADMFSKLGE